MAVTLPVNGCLGSDWAGWVYERVFRRQGSARTRLLVPPNAYIDYSGSQRRCIDGFRQIGEACPAE